MVWKIPNEIETTSRFGSLLLLYKQARRRRRKRRRRRRRRETQTQTQTQTDRQTDRQRQRDRETEIQRQITYLLINELKIGREQNEIDQNEKLKKEISFTIRDTLYFPGREMVLNEARRTEVLFVTEARKVIF